jgi:hypothetical protein
MERESVNTSIKCKIECAASSKAAYGDKSISILKEKFLFVLCLVTLFSFQAFSQSKYEKEFRIKESDVPSRALSFVDSITFDSKVKWYKEIGLDHITFEAKAISNKERHSIEFSENGIFQDVEIEVDVSKIPSDIYTKITGFLTLSHKKHKIEKVQIQYTGERDSALMFLRENRNNSKGITISYEVIISTKMDGNFVMMEYLFSAKGEYLQSKQIISKRKDTIDY